MNGSFLFTRSWIPELIYNTTWQRSREFSIHSRKICSVPLNCTTKTGQTIFIWQNTRDCDHYRASKQQNYLQRFHSFIKKSFLFRSKALASSSPVHRLTHSLYPGPDTVCWHLTSHLITKLPLCSDSSCWRNLNWTDTFAEVLVVWKHFKILLFPFHFLTNGQHTFSSGTIPVDTEWA